MREGVGLVVRRAERHDEGLAKLAASLSQHIAGEVHVQLFVTPASTHGFGWHYDDEEVFIVQTAGAKDYFFRDSRAAAATQRGAGLQAISQRNLSPGHRPPVCRRLVVHTLALVAYGQVH